MHKAEAIILQKQPFSEADELVLCYTKDQGKMLFRARGVRKSGAKHAGALRQCNRTDVYYVEGKRGPIATDTTLQESYAGIRASEQKLAATQKTCEALARIMPPSFTDMVLWWQLGEYLQVLNDFEGEDGQIAIAPTFFMFTFLRLHGTRMEVERCTRCEESFENEDVFYLSPEHGGLVHLSCIDEGAKVIELSPVGRALLRNWATLSLQQVLAQEVSEEVREEVVRGVEHFSAWHLGEVANMHSS